MANPKLPGIPEAEQALLYAKLNEYNRGRMSYKEAGAYFVVLPRPGHPTYSVWIYSPTLEKNRLLFIHELSADINESLRMASTLFFFSRRCLLIVEYNEKRMQSNGDDIISFGRYRGHYLHEILKVDPAYLSWIAYKYTPKIPKQERFVAIAQVYHSVHLDIMQRKARQIVTLTDPSGNLVVLRISSKTPSPVSCQLPALEHEFRPGEIVHIASARIARTYESYGSKYTRLSHVKFLIGT